MGLFHRILFLPAMLVFSASPLGYLAAETIEDKFNGITSEQIETYNIAYMEWRGNHAYLLGCHGCAGVEYNTATGVVENSDELDKIPDSWTIRFPLEWNGRVVVHFPGGVLDHTAFANLPYLGTMLNDHYAVVVVNHPAPGHPGFPYLDFIEPPYHSHDFRKGFLATSHQIKDLISEIFGAPEQYYGFAPSRGMSLGMGILLDEPGAPFDGYLMYAGGNGFAGSFHAFQEAYRSAPKRLALTGLPPVQVTAEQQVARLIFFLEPVDPNYKAYILSAPTVAEQLTRGLAYDSAQQSRRIQQGWAALEMGADLQRPTIYIQGLRDRTVPVDGGIHFLERIGNEGREALLRNYFVKDMAHMTPNEPPGLPNSTVIDGLAKLDAWVRTGLDPDQSTGLNVAPFAATPPSGIANRQLSCGAMGMAPMDCFCEVLGSGVGGVCSGDNQVACITANPTLGVPAPPDNCVALGKGVCQPVVPPECGN